MGIGVGIFLLAIGAVLAFAVEASVSGLDIAVVGVILMVAGVLGIVLELAVFAPRRRAVTYVDPGVAPVRRTTIDERDVY